MQDLQVVDVVLSLAEGRTRARANRERAAAAVRAGPGAGDHLAHRVGARLDAGVHVAVADDGAVAEDHKVRLT
jgi:hypothetical protein